MEDHPIMFLFLAVAYIFIAAYNVLKITVIVIVALYKLIRNKFKKEVDNNVINRRI